MMLGTTSNLSRGGMSVRFETPTPVGETVEFDLTLVFDEATRSEKLTVTGRIAWCTPVDAEHHVGVSFLGLSIEQIQYLDLFIRYLEDTRQRARDAEPSVNDDVFGG